MALPGSALRRRRWPARRARVSLGPGLRQARASPGPVCGRPGATGDGVRIRRGEPPSPSCPPSRHRVQRLRGHWSGEPSCSRVQQGAC